MLTLLGSVRLHVQTMVIPSLYITRQHLFPLKQAIENPTSAKGKKNLPRHGIQGANGTGFVRLYPEYAFHFRGSQQFHYLLR